MRIYVSSTFEDLRDYRDAVIRVLRQLGHDVAAMEDYVAEGAVPLDKVLEDVADSDVYVGIFAWRYGFIPKTNVAVKGATPGKTSITEYEYRKAIEANKPALIFLLNERAAWPVHLVDRKPKEATAMRRLRLHLQNKHLVSFFETPDGLASRVSTAISTHVVRTEMKSHFVSPFGEEIIQSFTGGDELSESNTGVIVKLFEEARPKRAVVIDISSTWWSTRLYLLAALGQDLGDLQRILVRDHDGFIGLVSSSTVRTTLRRIHSQANRFESQALTRDLDSDITKILKNCIDQWNKLFNARTGSERDVALAVTPPNLRNWFGEAFQERTLLVQNLKSPSNLDMLRILDYPNDFVPLQQAPNSQGDNNMDNQEDEVKPFDIRLVDKRQLTTSVARTTVIEMLDRAGVA